MRHDVDMLADQVERLVADADQVAGAERVELLARAASFAIDPLRRIELLMLVADAAGRAAHLEAGAARQGKNRPGGAPATYELIGAAAGLSRDVAYRQHMYGAALAWPAKRRGVRTGRTSARREEPQGGGASSTRAEGVK